MSAKKLATVKQQTATPKMVWVWREFPLAGDTANLSTNPSLEIPEAWLANVGRDRIWTFPMHTVPGMRFHVPTLHDRHVLARSGLDPRRPDWHALRRLLIESGRTRLDEDFPRLTASRLVEMLSAPASTGTSAVDARRKAISIKDAAKLTGRNKGDISRWAKRHKEVVAQLDPHGRKQTVYFDALQDFAARPRRESAKKAEARMERTAKKHATNSPE
jgi:hypothetical protein